MDDAEILSRFRGIMQEAQALAAADNVMARVAAERIAALVADLLYEIDVDCDDIIGLMPEPRRGSLGEARS